MRRYQHVYGGIATNLGPFSRTETQRWLRQQGIDVTLPKDCRGEGKLVDLITAGREVVVYPTRYPHRFTITVINR